MKNSKKVLATAIGAALISASVMIPTANAEVSASVSVANKYLWRGIDLGAGDAAVSGDLSISGSNGLYAGIWGSSGDAGLGSEYDLYAGWGGKLGVVDVDASIWSYNYPSSDIDPGEVTDLVLSAGIKSFTGTLYETVQGDSGNDYRYVTLGYDFSDKINAMVGIHDDENSSDNPTHIQLGYNYNDNLSFGVSQYVADEDSALGTGLGTDSDTQFLVSYTLPLK